MRRLWLVVVWLLTALAAIVAADQSITHKNALEPVVKVELVVPTDVVVGVCLLKAGTYIVMCDKEVVSFTLKSTGERMLTASCNGPVMKERAKETRAVYETQPSGYIVMDRLYLKGNNVEHIF